MLKFLVACCCLLVVSQSVTAGWIAPAPIAVRPAAIALAPAITTTNIVKAPLIAPAPVPVIGLAPWGLGLKAPWGLGVNTLG